MLHNLSGSHFERVVAELLTHQGYEATVFPDGPDGGVDVYAARREEIGFIIYLVQCKRWSAHRPAGLDVVQLLYGRIAADQATAGVDNGVSSGVRQKARARGRVFPMRNQSQKGRTPCVTVQLVAGIQTFPLVNSA